MAHTTKNKKFPAAKLVAVSGSVPRKKKAFLLLALVLVFALIGGYAVKMTFAQSNIKICNSSASARAIKVYKLNAEQTYSQLREPDQCTGLIENTGWNPVRVDTGSYGSYKLGKIGSGYGPCHEGRHYASNPPDDNAPDGVRYRNYDVPHCDF
jgi:hypothetical protein